VGLPENAGPGGDDPPENGQANLRTTPGTMNSQIRLTAITLLFWTATVEAQDPSERVQLHLDGIAGFAGELSVDVDVEGQGASSFADKPLEPSLGGYLGASVPIGHWFALEGGVALWAWRTNEMDREGRNREQLIDVVAKPRARLRLGSVELYAAMPLGLAVPRIADHTAPNLRVAGAELSKELGWTIGAAAGGQVFVLSAVGLRAEVGYQRHSFGYSVDDVVPATSFKAAFHQVVLSLGVVYAI